MIGCPLWSGRGAPYARPVAVLQRIGEETRVPLPAQTLVGRSATCGLQLDDKFVSSEHAKIQWTGGVWTIRDLGSRNGTFVDGRRVPPGEQTVLNPGVRIGFGDLEETYTLLDAAPPGPMATDVTTRAVRAAAGELLLLPDDEAPRLSVYPADAGGWVAEDLEGEVRRVTDQEVLVVDDRAFRLDLPVLSEATPMVDMAFTLENVDLEFAVSADEERVAVGLSLRGVEAHRLEPREHSYLLVTLARARAEDAEQPAADRGWRNVDDLQRMLRIDSNALNVAIHRARQQLAATGLEGAAGVVQTRRGQRRLGTDRFTIVPLVED